MMFNATLSKRWVAPATITALAISVLTACGGSSNDTPVDGKPTPTSLTLTGTAATGAAISGKLVEAKCAMGATSATTLADGSFSLSVSAGTWPCVLHVTAADGSVLHSLAIGSGASTIANITPVTQLIVASLAAADPAAYYASFDATVAAAVTSSALGSAQAAIVAMLKAAGIDLTAVGDLISAAMKAKTPTNEGDAYDHALDNLANAFTSSGTTLATLTSAVVTKALGSTSTSATASLPAELLLQPAAANCAALRSGTYRVVTPTAGAPLASQFGTTVINATTLASTRSDGTTASWIANGACRFTGDSGRTDAVVSPAGVIVLRYTNNGGSTYQVALAFPEQAHALAELVGSWNIIGMEVNAARTGYTGIAASATLDAAGIQSAVTWCQNDSTWGVKGSDCASPTGPVPSLQADDTGGFDFIEAGTSAVTGRAFAYRSGSGNLMLVGVNADGSFQVRAIQGPNPLPTVGATATSWGTNLANQLASPSAVDATSITVVSVDSAAQIYLRTQQTVGTTNAHPDTVFVNSPRNGYNFRAAGTAIAVDGSTVNVSEFTALGLPGMGFTPLLLPGPKWFDFSTRQPS